MERYLEDRSVDIKCDIAVLRDQNNQKLQDEILYNSWKQYTVRWCKSLE